jgi:hypothetical protein
MTSKLGSPILFFIENSPNVGKAFVVTYSRGMPSLKGMCGSSYWLWSTEKYSELFWHPFSFHLAGLRLNGTYVIFFVQFEIPSSFSRKKRNSNLKNHVWLPRGIMK